MHTARDGRTDLPPPFSHAGTVGDEDRNADLDRRGGRRLAHAVADAFPDSTAATD